MKRNLFLGSILGLLLVAIYFFDEKNDLQKNQEELVKQKILDLGKMGVLKSLKFDEFTIDPEHELVIEEGRETPLDYLTYQSFLNAIKDLKAVRAIDPSPPAKKEDFLAEESPCVLLTFESNEVQFCVGKNIELSEHFYISMKHKDREQIYVAYDDSPSDQIIQEGQQFIQGHHKFKTLFSLNAKLFYNRSPFKDFQKLTSFSVQDKMYSSFGLSFNPPEITPPPPKGIKISSESFEEFENKILALKALEYLPTAHLLPNLKERRQFILKDLKKELLFDVYIDRQGKILLRKNGEEGGFWIRPEDSPLILVNQQNFWEKIPLPLLKNSFQLELSYQKQFAKFQIEAGQQFAAKKMTHQNPDQAILKNLIELFNQSSDFILEVTKLDKIPTQSLKVTIDDRPFQVFNEAKMLVFLDLSQQLKFYYKDQDQLLPLLEAMVLQK